MSNVIVIGAGLAGLSTACHLTGAGQQVTVIERESMAGGRAGQIERAGFTFDTGPSVLTMPELIADALAAVGARMADVLPMRRLDPAYRARFADGSTIHVRHGHDDMREEIRRSCGDQDAAAFDDFSEWLRRLYQVEMPHFINKNFNSPLGLIASPRAAIAMVALGGFGKLGPAIRRRFRDPRLHRLFSFQALYAGLSPESALALYAVITYMDSIEGVRFPDGGMRAIPAAMALACEKAGAEFRYGETVSHVLRRSDGGGVAGVQLVGGEKLQADAVVCTVDLPVAYENLLPDLPPPGRLARARYSPSAVVWHVGTREAPKPEVAHHNIHFGQEWSAAFDALLTRKTLMPDPSRLVTIPSVHDRAAVPIGGSTLFVLEPVPNLTADINWKHETAPMRDRLYAFLEREGYPTDVVVEEIVTPMQWQQQGMQAGTPFSLAHTFAQTGPFRPPNVEKRLPGMMFAGSGTVPGVGVPMVLISGRLAADRVRAYLTGRR